ncbi:hypothetical protein HK102_006452, partial [Quaeritorhiza haematococci]
MQQSAPNEYMYKHPLSVSTVNFQPPHTTTTTQNAQIMDWSSPCPSPSPSTTQGLIPPPTMYLPTFGSNDIAIHTSPCDMPAVGSPVASPLMQPTLSPPQVSHNCLRSDQATYQAATVGTAATGSELGHASSLSLRDLIRDSLGLPNMIQHQHQPHQQQHQQQLDQFVPFPTPQSSPIIPARETAASPAPTLVLPATVSMKEILQDRLRQQQQQQHQQHQQHQHHHQDQFLLLSQPQPQRLLPPQIVKLECESHAPESTLNLNPLPLAVSMTVNAHRPRAISLTSRTPPPPGSGSKISGKRMTRARSYSDVRPSCGDHGAGGAAACTRVVSPAPPTLGKKPLRGRPPASVQKSPTCDSKTIVAAGGREHKDGDEHSTNNDLQ